MPNNFVRSQIKDTAHFKKLLVKIAGIKGVKKNAFNVDFGSTRFHGEDMTAFNLTSDPTMITFSAGGLNYSFLLTDIKIVKRIRTRKYLFVVNVLTIVP